ncbi:MAG: glycosyltransferase family 1 protein, partial [Bacteroidetes bacterium]|nr:glycosyltransferase family 1 protein [Bacteroidota bacterium]
QSGVAEVLRHALKVDFWDIDALSDAIYGLLHYEALSKMFILHGKEEVNSMKWDDSAIKVRLVYEMALSREN